MVGLGYYRLSKNKLAPPSSVFVIISITLLAKFIANKIKFLSFWTKWE